MVQLFNEKATGKFFYLICENTKSVFVFFNRSSVFEFVLSRSTDATTDAKLLLSLGSCVFLASVGGAFCGWLWLLVAHQDAEINPPTHSPPADFELTLASC